jgi:uncharacterized membrane protein
MAPLVPAVAIGGFAILHAVVFWFLPGLTRRDVYFAVTVTPGFRDRPDGRAILQRYRIDLTVFSALVFAVMFAGVRQLGVAFMPVALVLVHTGSFAGFYRARQRVMRYAVAPTTIREVDLGRRDQSIPGGRLLALGPFLPIAACAALLWMRGKETAAGLYFPSVAGILAAFTILRYGMSHWARCVHVGGPELVKEMRFRRTASLILLIAEYVIAAQSTWIVLMPHHGNLMRGSNAGIVVAEFAGLLILTLAAVLVLARMGQGGSRLTASRDACGCGHAEPVGDRTEDRYWRLGIFYFNRDDAAVVVERRFGLGYTLNFARAETWVMMTFLLAAPVIRVVGSRLHR